MEKKENQRIVLTKRLLKESLLQLMETKSIQKISVSELCQTAGINRTTFYHHYGNPSDLLKEIELDMIADLERIWQERGAAQDWTLSRRAEALCLYFREHEHIAKLLFRNSDTNSEFAALLFHSTHAQQTFRQGLSGITDPDSQKLMITLFTNGIYSLIRQWILEDIPKTPKELAELICSFSIHEWEHMAE